MAVMRAVIDLIREEGEEIFDYGRIRDAQDGSWEAESTEARIAHAMARTWYDLDVEEDDRAEMAVAGLDYYTDHVAEHLDDHHKQHPFLIMMQFSVRYYFPMSFSFNEWRRQHEGDDSLWLGLVCQCLQANGWRSYTARAGSHFEEGHQTLHQGALKGLRPGDAGELLYYVRGGSMNWKLDLLHVAKVRDLGFLLARWESLGRHLKGLLTLTLSEPEVVETLDMDVASVEEGPLSSAGLAVRHGSYRFKRGGLQYEVVESSPIYHLSFNVSSIKGRTVEVMSRKHLPALDGSWSQKDMNKVWGWDYLYLDILPQQ